MAAEVAKHIKLGRTVDYVSAAKTGTGKIVRIESMKTGVFVTIDDRTNFRYITVRQQRVTPA